MRALAIAAVVGYHAIPGFVAGGFVGVDVFFVLSGFLITSLILREEAQGRFCLKRFYVRRAVRILPALGVTLAGVLAIAWWLLLAHEFHDLLRNMESGFGDFLRFTVGPEAGYFEGSIEERPLLHLWSLAVEAQFYVLWPLVLILARGRRQQCAVMLAIIVASFLANVAMVGDVLARAYYVPQSRIWQLALGGLLALLLDKEDWRHGTNVGKFHDGAADLASIAGLAMIIVPALSFTDRLAYPGWWAPVPTLGALLVIASGEQAIVNRRILSARLVVGAGLLSYALYLWHWPLIAFRNILDLEDSAWATALCLATAVALAAATYRFVEKPLRSLRMPARLPGAGPAQWEFREDR